ncbi:ATP-binding protein, partial [Thermodesulfobacteriota bacterium]
EQILQAGGRAKDLIKQILTFSRQQEQERVAVEIGSIVKEALRLLRVTIPRHIEIRYSMNAEGCKVMADSTQVHQILINLCTNAAHAMQENGGLLEVCLDEVLVHGAAGKQIAGLPDGSYLELSVSDTGMGMDDGVMERIFDPYFTTKGPSEGTGMGLSVVHGIVKSHGGAITVNGIFGKGSTFTVYLPKLTRDIPMQDTDEVPLRTGSEHILLVDDEEILTDVGREMLEQIGYTVTTKTCPLDALDSFRAAPKQFDLVITDESMPHMSGHALAREMLDICAQVPVILCSGLSDPADVEKAKARGFKELIVKPIDMRRMATTIRYVLDHPA